MSVPKPPRPRAVVLGCAGTTLSAEESDLYRRADPLGFILFRRNCETPRQVRDLVAAMPVTAAEAADPQLAGAFTVERKSATDAVPERQAQVEQKWAAFAKENYAAARKKAEEALALAR